MLDGIVQGLLDLSGAFVTPDWGQLILLIPLGLAALVFLNLTWTIFRLATAGPTRRGVRRLTPIAPPDVHMPGPSFAPLLAAVGAFFLLFGLFAGGPWLPVGVAVLVVTLLYWGREALRDYDHLPGVAPVTALVPATPVEPKGPPPGVHVPPPSFQPLLVSVAMTMLVAGLLVGGIGLLVGILAVVVAGLGWLRDARREYSATEAADRTGHLDLGGAPAWPVGTLAVLAVMVAGALLLGSGVLDRGAGEAAAPSAAPGTSAAPGEASAGPSQGAPVDADAYVSAKDVLFVETAITVPAGREFTLAFENKEAVPHNVEIRDGSGTMLFKGDLVTGPETVLYTVPALAAGEYPFICSVHPNMTGTVTAQ